MAQLIKRSRRKSPLKRKKSGKSTRKSGRKSGRKSLDRGVEDFEESLDKIAKETDELNVTCSWYGATKDFNELKEILTNLRAVRNSLLEKISGYKKEDVHQFICRSVACI
jgi:hypothetical protein